MTGIRLLKLVLVENHAVIILLNVRIQYNVNNMLKILF